MEINSILAYHGKGGYMKLTDSSLTPLAEIYRKGAEEIGYKTVDANGEDQIGGFLRLL